MSLKLHLASSCLGLTCAHKMLNACLFLMSDQVLLDSECRPWLMEVNCSPALSMDGPVDTEVKVPLLKDTIQMVTLHSRLLRTPAPTEASSARCSSASLSKGSLCSVAPNPIASARTTATGSQKSFRSLSAPRFVYGAVHIVICFAPY